MSKEIQELKLGQRLAIRRGVTLGKELQREHPELVDLYREGLGYREIAEELDLASHYAVTDTVAFNAVRFALTGYSGSVGRDRYEGLLDSEEAQILAQEHLEQSGRLRGLQAYEDGIGLFSMTLEERSDAGRKGGSIGGRKCYEEGTGMFSLSEDERREAGKRGGEIAGRQNAERGIGIAGMSYKERKRAGSKGGSISGPRLREAGKGIFAMSKDEQRDAGKKSARSRGFVPWIERQAFETHTTLSEAEIVYNLSLLPEYQRKSQPNKGKPDVQKIVDEVNRVFHGGEEIRTKGAIYTAIRRERIKRKSG